MSLCRMPFLRYSASDSGVTLKSELGVIQGQWKRHRSLDRIRVPIGVSIVTMGNFRDKTRYWSKTGFFHTPSAFDAPRLGGGSPSEYRRNVWCILVYYFTCFSILHILVARVVSNDIIHC